MSAIFSYLFQLFTYNNKPVFFGAFPVQNLKIVYLAISFSDVYFTVTKRFIQVKAINQSILFKTSLLKTHISLCKLLLDFATTAINYVSLGLQSLSKDFFTIQETACS